MRSTTAKDWNGSEAVSHHFRSIGKNVPDLTPEFSTGLT